MWNHTLCAFVSVHLFSKGTLFFFCVIFCDIEFSIFDIETPNGLQMRYNYRGPFRNYKHNLGVKPLFLLGHHSLTPDRTRLVPPVAHTETREMQKAGRHTTEGKHITHNPRPEKSFT